MVRINKNLLKEKELQLLLKRFDSSFAKLSSQGVSILLNELLGNEERLTMAKRLTAVVLLHEGYSMYKTAQLLKLSHSTTAIIAERLENGVYNGTLRVLKRKRIDYTKLLDTIDSILHLGGFLPHRVGLDRYRHL